MGDTIAPGFVTTRMSVVNGVNELENDWFKQATCATADCRSGAAPGKIADVAVWLASGSSTYITGQVTTVDGGLFARF